MGVVGLRNHFPANHMRKLNKPHVARVGCVQRLTDSFTAAISVVMDATMALFLVIHFKYTEMDLRYSQRYVLLLLIWRFSKISKLNSFQWRLVHRLVNLTLKN
jgi:hypothetical protein